jgi:hypothetical protein
MTMADAKIIARPWQPQDLIDDLQGIIDEECDNYLNTRRTTLCMARDYLKEHFAEQQWIPVAERLPEENERVLVYHDDGVIRFGINKCGFADVVSTLYLQNHHRTCFSKVTHWMPLPQPPKGE